MKARELGELGLRLLGVYLVVQAFTLLPTMAGYLYAFSASDLRADIGLISTGFIPIVILLLSAFALLVQPAGLAKRLFPDSRDIDGLSGRDVLGPVAFSVVGVLVFSSSIPGLVSTAAAIVFFVTGTGGKHGFPWTGLIAYPMQGMLGLVFFFRGSAVASWLRRRESKDLAA